MKNICMYFQVHQPYRLKRFRIFDIGNGTHYFDDEQNRAILRKVAHKCYLPTNQLLLDLIKRTEGRFKVAFSLSGALLKQLVAEAPEVLASFQELAATGSVEILGETYYHSLSAIGHKDEFIEQVDLHRGTIERLFGQRPRVFRNTELIYFDELAPLIADMGFKAILAEGADKVLQWRSPNYVYETTTASGLKLLLRNYRLSDDVGFRFSERSWEGWPVTADKYVNWVAASLGETVNLFMDYETFGEHQWAETGIFDFLRHFPFEAERHGLKFVNPSELAGRTPTGTLSFPTPTSWADVERDLSAWLGNRLQNAAHERLYKLRSAVMATGDQDLIERWRKLSTSDHFYYICTKWFADGD
ncbi:alpha-amylase, partial [Candidatus Acetothermia bacterium]|nr:alpha-amylase [Candidatus Acetothermia bacterium]